MFVEFREWQDQLKSGNSLKEKTDLSTLTHFLEVMQVKYGSRWISSAMMVREFWKVYVKNPKELAAAIYGKFLCQQLWL